MPSRPLALDSDQLVSQIEDQVVAFDGERVPYANPELGGTVRDRELGHGSFLIGREHVSTVAPGSAGPCPK